MSNYQQWSGYHSFGGRFSKLCGRLELNASEDGRAIVVDHLIASPDMSLAEFTKTLHSSFATGTQDGAARQQTYNDWVSYCSVAARLRVCAKFVLPDGNGIKFLRAALIEDPAMSLEDFTARLADATPS